MLLQDCVLAVMPGATETERVTLVRVAPDESARVHCQAVCGLARPSTGSTLRLVREDETGDVVSVLALRPASAASPTPRSSQPHFELRQETFAEGLGWSVQSRIRLTAEQMRMLRGGLPRTGVTPAVTPAI